jgi:hypothetical protein
MIPISGSWAQSILRALLAPDTNDLLGLSNELGASIVLEVDRPEWQFFKNQRFYSTGGRSQAAVVGQFSYVGIRVPKIDLVTVAFMVKNVSAVVANLILGDLGSLSVIPGEIIATPAVAPMDSEHITQIAGGTSLGSATVSSNGASVAGVGSGVYTFHDSLAAGERVSHEQHGYVAILRPGGFLALETQAFNLAVAGTIWFYERPARKGRFFV